MHLVGGILYCTHTDSRAQEIGTIPTRHLVTHRFLALLGARPVNPRRQGEHGDHARQASYRGAVLQISAIARVLSLPYRAYRVPTADLLRPAAADRQARSQGPRKIRTTTQTKPRPRRYSRLEMFCWHGFGRLPDPLQGYWITKAPTRYLHDKDTMSSPC